MAIDRKSFHRHLNRYAKSHAGNVTMITALASLPLFLSAGAAIDYASMTRDIAAFQAAADSAVVAVVTSDKARITGLSGAALAQRMAELDTLATNYMKRNYTNRSGNTSNFDLTLTIDGQKVRLDVAHEVDVPILGSFGILSPTVNITSEIKKAATPVELMLVMDTTGSMGTTYMAQAKTAAHNLLTKVYGGTLATEPESEYIRVGLVPFSGAVRLDTAASDFSLSWIDTTGAATVSKLNFSNTAWHNYLAWTQLLNQPWNGCVEARSGSYATDDTAPVSGNTLFTPYFSPDEPTFSNSTSSPDNYLNSYIGSSGTPNETTGITTANCTGWSSSSTSTANLTCRQNNVSKYIAKSITAETTASSSYGPWFNCAKSKLVSLTYDRSKVEAGIDAMTANGSTVIPEGLAWGWRAMSPTAPLTKVGASTSFPQTTIAPYGDARWQKIMVLMSDGENDVLSNGGQVSPLNGTWYSAYGRGKAVTNNRFGLTSTQITNFSSNPGVTATALDTKMAAICNNIKAQGIIIYSVGFRVNSTAMQNCASPDTDVNNKHYSYAADGVALAAVFSHIGENVSNTSIYLSK